MNQQDPCTPLRKTNNLIDYIKKAGKAAQKSWGIVLLFLLVGLAPVFYFAYNVKHKPEPQYVTIQYQQAKPKEKAPGAEFSVFACRVVDGYVFQVLIETNEWIEVHLKTATKDEATAAVVDVLKTGISPSVVLKRQVGGYWIVDFNLTIKEKRTTLLEWLQEKQLTL